MKRIFLLLVVPVFVMASDINGVIRDRLERTPLDNAIVKLIKLPESEVIQTIITDEKGGYFISDVKSGTYQIEASKPDYYKNVLFDFTIEPQKHYECNIDLLQRMDCRRGQKRRQKHGKTDDSEYCFMIGSIEVKSHGDELIPEESVTTRKISSGEIEHMQATSLGDVLNLIPGIEKSQNPGLSEASKVGIRANTIEGTEGLLETFGTSIIVDQNELSSSVDGDITTGRGGIDLRTIPADNIESVEVISGIPSAEYGDFSNGIIKVKTKSGIAGHKIKAKLNPDTKTASYSSGKKFKNSFLNYNINYGYSERDLRLNGDEYHRFYGLLGISQPFLNNKLNTRTIFTFTKIKDNEAPTGIYKFKDYNNGYKTSTSFSFDYEKSEKSEYSGFLSLNLNRKKDFTEKLVADPIYFDSTTVYVYENHTYTDTLVPIYTGKKTEKGYEIHINSNLKYKRKFSYYNLEHDFLTGINGKFEQNKGEGLVLDSIFNYYGFSSPKRSRSYDDYGNLNQYSLFIQDKIKGKIFSRNYKLNIGMRYTAFNPKTVDLKHGLLNTQHGEFWCPRLNFQYFLNKNFRFRFGVGKSAKSISLRYIYRDPVYEKYLNEEGEIIEDMELQNNPNLQAYTTTKYEASVDWSPIKIIGMSLTGYYSTSDDKPALQSYPFGYSVNPDSITESSYSVYRNIGWSDSWGVEYVLKTKRIKNIQLKMNITYRYSENGKTGKSYDNSPDSSYGETTWYYSPKYWKEKLIIDYQINYVSQRLGAWATLDIQYIPVHNTQTIYNSVKYERDINDETYIFYQGQTKWYDLFEYHYGGKWIYNLRITKSLSQKTEVSLYINNLLDDRALWKHPYQKTSSDKELNPEIYYGLEVSTQW